MNRWRVPDLGADRPAAGLDIVFVMLRMLHQEAHRPGSRPASMLTATVM